MTRALARAAAGALASLALLAAPAGAAVGPPYEIEDLGGATLEVAPVGASSTLAVQVRRTAAGIEFEPAAALFPAGCTSTLLATTCPEALLATELRLQGTLLHADVELHDMTTGTVRLTGGAGADTIVVDGPLAGPHAIGQVVLDPGAGNDSVTIGGIVNAVVLAAADPGGDDRYVVDSTTVAAATLALGDGNDVGSSKAPNLTLDGGTGDDLLSGSGALLGGGGSDTLAPAVLGTAIAGGAGDVDRLTYALVSAPLTITKTAATDLLVGGDSAAKTGIDRLEGGAGNDRLQGTGGQDFLAGGEGDDLVDGRGGGDVLDGGPGMNTVSYESGAGPVTVDLRRHEGGTLPLDELTGFRRVVTGPGNDNVVGSAADEAFALGGGDDVLDAREGSDTADGGPGNDVLRGWLGSDVLDGGAGVDTADYSERTASEPIGVTLATLGGDGAEGENDSLLNIENLAGGASNDTLVGDAGANTITGGPGVNTLDGGAGDDQVFGGDGRDVIAGGPGNDGLYGYGDDDSINAFDAAKPDTDVVSCGESLDDDAQVDETDTVSGCEFSRRADVPVPVDDDHDGFVGGFDCDDHDPARNQGATDVPGDGVDQDCDGFDSSIPFVDYGLSASISKPARSQRGIRFKRFVITRLLSDRRVAVTCTSAASKVGRCPFKKAALRPKAGASQVSLTALFKNRRLAPGTKVEFRVTAPKLNGRVRRFTVRAAALQSRELCLVAPRTTPRACPEGDEL